MNRWSNRLLNLLLVVQILLSLVFVGSSVLGKFEDKRIDHATILRTAVNR